MHNELPQSVWLVAEDQDELALSPALRDRLLAYLIQGVLSEGALVVPDSYLVNNVNLRKLLKQSDVCRGLIERGYLRVAARRVAGRRISLPELRDQFLTDGKRPPGFEETEFKEDSSFRLLEDAGHFNEYDLGQVAGNYTSGVMHTFGSSIATQLLGETVQQQARQVIAEQFERGGDLSYKFFFYDVHPDTNAAGLGRLLDERVGRGTWARLASRVRELAHGPYVTGLPDILDLGPVYHDAHARAIDLWRRRRLEQADLLAEPLEFGTYLDLSTYEQALLQIRLEDVVDLHNPNGPWGELRAALRSLGVDQASARAAQGVFMRYRKTVEKRIAKRLGAEIKEDAERVQVKTNIGRLIGEPAEFVFLSLLNPVLGAAIGTLTVAWRTVQRLRRRDEASLAAADAATAAENDAMHERAEIERVAKDLDPHRRITATTAVHRTARENLRDTLVKPA